MEQGMRETLDAIAPTGMVLLADTVTKFDSVLGQHNMSVVSVSGGG